MSKPTSVAERGTDYEGSGEYVACDCDASGKIYIGRFVLEESGEYLVEDDASSDDADVISIFLGSCKRCS